MLKRWLAILLLCFTLPVQADVSNAIVALLTESFKQYEAQKYEQAAALLERALGIDVSNPVLWHNLAGVRLKQEDWKRAADLATKSNTLITGSEQQKGLRIRNFMLIALACEGMQANECAEEARKRAYALAKSS